MPGDTGEKNRVPSGRAGEQESSKPAFKVGLVLLVSATAAELHSEAAAEVSSKLVKVRAGSPFSFVTLISILLSNQIKGMFGECYKPSRQLLIQAAC